ALALGFLVPPPKTSFPNSTISLYASVDSPRFGARQAPLGPDVSSLSGAAGAQVVHTFTVINDGDAAMVANLSIVGWQWQATTASGNAPLPTAITVDPGESEAVTVTVTVPLDAAPGTSDHGFLQLRDGADPPAVHAVEFVTTAANLPLTEQPKVTWQYWNG